VTGTLAAAGTARPSPHVVLPAAELMRRYPALPACRPILSASCSPGTAAFLAAERSIEVLIAQGASAPVPRCAPTKWFEAIEAACRKAWRIVTGSRATVDAGNRHRGGPDPGSQHCFRP